MIVTLLHQNIIPITVTALLLGMLLSYVLMRWLRTHRLRKRFKRGAEGEVEALRFLQQNGFKEIVAQPETSTVMHVNGEKRMIDLRVDYAAVRRGKRCIIEVKTGARAVDPCTTETRRQLFEYAAAYRACKAFLFDAESAVLHEISFPALGKRRFAPVALFGAGLAVGMVIGITVHILK